MKQVITTLALVFLAATFWACSGGPLTTREKGAGIGALVGGKKGALIGGLVGGAAGTVYDRKTHKKVVRE